MIERCKSCGGSELVNAVDNHGQAYRGCGQCRVLREVEPDWAGSTLAHNLAIGAALCRAHYNALDEAEEHRLYHEYGYRLYECWSPGCGRSAP